MQGVHVRRVMYPRLAPQIGGPPVPQPAQRPLSETRLSKGGHGCCLLPCVQCMCVRRVVCPRLALQIGGPPVPQPAQRPLSETRLSKGGHGCCPHEYRPCTCACRDACMVSHANDCSPSLLVHGFVYRWVVLAEEHPIRIGRPQPGESLGATTCRTPQVNFRRPATQHHLARTS